MPKPGNRTTGSRTPSGGDPPPKQTSELTVFSTNNSTGKSSLHDVVHRLRTAASTAAGNTVNPVTAEGPVVRITNNPPATVVTTQPHEHDLSARHKVASDLLAERFDALNGLFTRAEAKLKSLKPLRSVWVYYNSYGDMEGCETYESLGLHKLDNSWRLVHGTDNDRNDVGPYDIQPIVECSAEVRIRAVRQVRVLHERIIEQKEKLVPELEKAITELDKYCTEA